MLLLLPLIAGVIVPTRQALALSACYADAVGTWRGPVLNGSGVEDMITTFSLGPDGRLVVALPHRGRGAVLRAYIEQLSRDGIVCGRLPLA